MSTTCSTYTTSRTYYRLSDAPYGPPLPTRRHDDYRLQVFALSAAFVIAAVFALVREVSPYIG